MELYQRWKTAAFVANVFSEMEGGLLWKHIFSGLKSSSFNRERFCKYAEIQSVGTSPTSSISKTSVGKTKYLLFKQMQHLLFLTVSGMAKCVEKRAERCLLKNDLKLPPWSLVRSVAEKLCCLVVCTTAFNTRFSKQQISLKGWSAVFATDVHSGIWEGQTVIKEPRHAYS